MYVRKATVKEKELSVVPKDSGLWEFYDLYSIGFNIENRNIPSDTLELRYITFDTNTARYEDYSYYNKLDLDYLGSLAENTISQKRKNPSSVLSVLDKYVTDEERAKLHELLLSGSLDRRKTISGFIGVPQGSKRAWRIYDAIIDGAAKRALDINERFTFLRDNMEIISLGFFSLKQENSDTSLYTKKQPIPGGKSIDFSLLLALRKYNKTTKTVRKRSAPALSSSLGTSLSLVTSNDSGEDKKDSEGYSLDANVGKQFQFKEYMKDIELKMNLSLHSNFYESFKSTLELIND